MQDRRVSTGLRSLLLSTAILAGSGIEAKDLNGSESVDASTAMVAIGGTPLEFVDALRFQGIPIGLVVTSDSWERFRARGGESRRTSGTEGRLTDVLATFSSSHPGWSTEIGFKGVIIRDRSIAPRTMTFEGFTVTDLPLYRAFVEAERLVNSEIPAVDGSVSSIISSGIAPPPEGSVVLPPDVSVSVALEEGGTLEDLLNLIASSAPGTAWVLVRHEGPDGDFDTLSIRFAGGMEADHHWPLPAE